MGRLQARLDRIKAAFLEKAPEEARVFFARATKELTESGILDGVPAIGSTLPPFELEDTSGTTVRSADLLAQGPLVLTVYRGAW